jgi:hypothetical protein
MQRWFEAFLSEWTVRLAATPLDPLKTTNVQNQRCMTTWVLQKAVERRSPVASDA